MVSSRLVVIFCAGELESCTTKVSDLPFTAAVGIPQRVPVDADRVSPAGIGPLAIDQLRGLAPPVADSVAE
jgi:hypothetical protein